MDTEREYARYQELAHGNGEFSTYAKWEKHIYKEIGKQHKNYRTNYEHSLKYKKRILENDLAIIDNVWMPLNIFVLTLLLTLANFVDNNNAVCKSLLQIIFIVISLVVGVFLYRCGKRRRTDISRKIGFYEEMISICTKHK